MTVKKLLKMHKEGVACRCVTIHRLPYIYDEHRYIETYFEEESQEDIFASETFRGIADIKVDHFNIIGGGMHKVELCVYLKD